jgi:thiol-disulfide isomerase/thioredoxin
LILTLLAAVALAQTPAPAAAPARPAAVPIAPATMATPPQAAGLTGEVKRVLDRAISTYTSASSYRDRLVIELELQFDGPAPAGLPEPQTVQLAFSRPNRLALRAPEYTVVCDGKTLWQQVVELEDYMESPAPAKLDLRELQLNRFGLLDQTVNPVAAVLTGTSTTPDTLFGKVLAYTGIAPETRKGVPGKTVSGMVDWGTDDAGRSLQVRFTGWFDDKSGLLREIVFDRTEIMQQRMAGSSVRIKKDNQHIRFEDIVVNGPVPPEAFTFRPGHYDRSVSEFKQAEPAEYQARLHGRPVPDFKTKELDGKPFNMASLKGKVVLLDLWSLNCRPCLMAMPKIQELATKYAGQPVEVIGVSIDPSELSEKVKASLKQGNIKYRQITDEDGRIAKFFRTIGIPYVILLDKEGVIRATRSGYRSNDPAVFDDQLSRLLKGQPLPTQPADEGPGMTAPAPQMLR